MNAPKIECGRPYPLGACVDGGGVNFALFSSWAQKVELCLFDGDTETRLTLPARSGDIHHGFVAGIGAGQHYGFRVHGHSDAAAGVYFNPQKLLLDPYATRVAGRPRYNDAESLAHFAFDDTRDNAAVAAKSVVERPSEFDWGNDEHPNTPWAHTVIYEAHVKGLTKKFPDLADAGTYRALTDKRVIGHLKSLGITAIELLPLPLHSDEYHLQQNGLVNYWGYNTYAHFAVEPRYAAAPEQAADELRAAVKALHQAGIEVILDVVFNHTAEQDMPTGLMLCQRGIDAPAWYWLDAHGQYQNWTGTGNTLNVAQRDVARWVMDCLRHWRQSFHIDGFRFDLASVLGREPEFHTGAHFFQTAYQDPLLAGCKLIAEPWDIGQGGYQLGAFPTPFAEWNDRFRDDIRAFWLRQSGRLGVFAERLAGSADVFRHRGKKPSDGINFLTAHDGFTLHDLVSYNEKHNEANGEGNRDGHHENFSDNHGEEGETDNAEIAALREYSAKALLATLFFANGTPMLLAGDELGNSQQGNNNGYCQDNEITWLDWTQQNGRLKEYVQTLAALRREMPLLNNNSWWDGRVRWLNSGSREMRERDWHDGSSKALQVLLDEQWLLLVNAKRGSQIFDLPKGEWLCRCAPSQHHRYADGRCQVGHMGLWLFHQQKPLKD